MKRRNKHAAVPQNKRAAAPQNKRAAAPHGFRTKKSVIHFENEVTYFMFIFCLWFRASLIYINSCPTRCNTKQSIYYSASSLYMFRVSTTPIIRSTQNCNYSLRYCAAWPRWREVAAQKIWPVPEAVVTVLCTPDYGCVWHPKHVEWACRIINRLLSVAFRWTVINTDVT